MTAGTVRLHITPFAPDFASIVLGTSLASHATNISFHSIQTFPENNYGFVDLPPMEAEKLKKKLNNSLLKGRKMRIENARPSRKKRSELEETTATEGGSGTMPGSQARVSRKRKSSEETVPAYMISEHRKVKRGWTEPRRKDRKKRSAPEKEAPASKYSEKAECLFRTKLPKNKADIKQVPDEKKMKHAQKASHTLVHEFQKSTNFPSFLRDRNTDRNKSAAIEFIDSKGWVDADGNVVEAVREPKPKVEFPCQVTCKRKQESQNEEEAEEGTDTTSDLRSDKSNPATSHQSDESERSQSSEQESTSSSGSDESSLEDSEEESLSDPGDSRSNYEVENEVSDSSNSTPDIPETQPTPHPLETLFKRPAPVRSKFGLSQSSDRSIARPSLEISTGFSFFGADDEDSREGVPPLTPFSSQDRQLRGIRSAAPTPDTAAPSRTSFFPGGSQPDLASDEDEDDEQYRMVHDYGTPTGKGSLGRAGSLIPAEPTDTTTTISSKAASSAVHEQPEQSEFVKWFYEHRGENNRLWKRRRREAAKEKRQAENRESARNAGRRSRG